MTWADIVQAWKQFAKDEVAPNGSMAWVGHPAIAEVLRTTIKDAGSGQFILGDRSDSRNGSIVAGRKMGVPIYETSHLTPTILTIGR